MYIIIILFIYTFYLSIVPVMISAVNIFNCYIVFIPLICYIRFNINAIVNGFVLYTLYKC